MIGEKMDKAIGFFGLGLWFGITGPLVLHWAFMFIEQVGRYNGTKIRAKTLDKICRFILGSLLMLGCLGIASVLGQTHGSSDYAAPGMFIGLAVSGFYIWLNHKIRQSNSQTNA